MNRWAVDVDPKNPDDVRIYSVPEINGLPIKLVARCESKEQAELIVSLYEERRAARG